MRLLTAISALQMCELCFQHFELRAGEASEAIEINPKHKQNSHKPVQTASKGSLGHPCKAWDGKVEGGMPVRSHLMAHEGTQEDIKSNQKM